MTATLSLSPFSGEGTHVPRPVTAVLVYLRMMYLKHRYGLGFEVLVKEVSDGITLIKLDP